ncbi:uridine kinase family protein [Paenibacillus xanthanilyticus]|uniref:Uridine kinase n=1 Tax=Paenibacillus xanthanilyticus TaxID=1783531 RepID=A0ABV8K2H7_9BACL
MQQGKPIIIGIGGGSGSGKTTLCTRMEAELEGYRVKSIHADKYYFRTRMKTAAPFTGKTYDDFNHPDSLDFPKMLEDLLRAANDGETEIVIVEGILVLHHAYLREWMDVKLYVECPADERLLRRTARFLQKGYAYEDIVNEYLELVRYRHDEFVEPTKWHADLIVNGSQGSETGVKIVLEWIRQAARSRKSFETVRDFNGKR